MKNIHILPTDKQSKLYYWEGKLRLGDLTTAPKNLGISNQHIYITSDEEIREGDWVFDIFKNAYPVIRQLTTKEEVLGVQKTELKIILTTNVELIEDGVQVIDDEFLEWFVKNPSCESVETEIVEYGFDEVPICIYKISIPKEEPKQETLEEAINNEINNIDINSSNLENIAKYNRISGTLLSELKKSMANIAKWQQERMYSEEDMEDYSNYCWKLSNDNRYKTPLSPKEWFEQFKKK